MRAPDVIRSSPGAGRAHAEQGRTRNGARAAWRRPGWRPRGQASLYPNQPAKPRRCRHRPAPGAGCRRGGRNFRQVSWSAWALAGLVSAEIRRSIYYGVSGFGATEPDNRLPSLTAGSNDVGTDVAHRRPGAGAMPGGFAAASVTTGMMTAFALATALYQHTPPAAGSSSTTTVLDNVLNFLASSVAETTVSNVKHQIGNLSMSRKPPATASAAAGVISSGGDDRATQFRRLFKGPRPRSPPQGRALRRLGQTPCQPCLPA